MRKINNNKLNEITGGSTLTSSMINAFVNIIKLIKEAGEDLGSSFRRMHDGALCPTK